MSECACVPTLSEGDRAELWGKYVPMTFKLAAHFAAKYNLPRQELEEAAADVWIDQVMAWDDPEQPGRVHNPESSSECTWAYKRIYYGLLDYCTRHRKRHVTLQAQSLDALVHRMAAPDRVLERSLQGLGQEAKDLVFLIMNAPADLVEDLKMPLPARKARNRLAGVLGWSAAMIDAAWAENRLREYVFDVLGWPSTKINKAWCEVAAVL